MNVINMIIGVSRELIDKPNISHLKLHKLAYITYGMSIYATGKQVMEPFLAWQYGPIHEPTWVKYSYLGSDLIKDHGCKCESVLVRKVWNHFGDWTDVQLSIFCRDYAWSMARLRGQKYVSDQDLVSTWRKHML